MSAEISRRDAETQRKAAATKPAKVLPLDPPATEAEKNEASRVWTAAQDVMVARGFGRYLWGNTSEATHDFVILMLRAAKATAETPGAVSALPEKWLNEARQRRDDMAAEKALGGRHDDAIVGYCEALEDVAGELRAVLKTAAPENPAETQRRRD